MNWLTVLAVISRYYWFNFATTDKHPMPKLIASLNKLCLPCLPALGLMLSATTHRMLFDQPDYTRSLLIPVEFFLVLVVLLGLVGMILLTLWFLAHTQWRDARHYSTCALANIVLLTGAFAVDAPTLIYMT
ncbi:MAG: hypothetical protein MJK04_27965 [Psychrosphaera sp.]|nr:hypothetical protein [Psychrosphaera sp.]